VTDKPLLIICDATQEPNACFCRLRIRSACEITSGRQAADHIEQGKN
jgi:hypothetical protein